MKHNDNERTTLTAWITKYVLTQGIFSTKVEVCLETNDRMVSDTERSMVYYHENDWHLTKEAAVKRANNIRNKKIASLKKSIERIKKLDFEKPSGD